MGLMVCEGRLQGGTVGAMAENPRWWVTPIFGDGRGLLWSGTWVWSVVLHRECLGVYGLGV